ncbi:MAG: hypothetical protein JWL90_843, partial [Chthoniobacteraceae bacterium]|nr:hypothetical protein [Chthoniobacteraceae bacterium]
MPPEITSETRFAFEGFLPLWTIILLGALFLAASCGMAWRERRFTERPNWIWLLVLFRTCAVLVLLWMLAGPTLVTALRKFKRKSVAVFIDTSASMGVADAADGSGNVSRWSVSQNNHARLLRQIDNASAQIRATLRQLAYFANLPDSTRDGTAARTLFSQAVDGVVKGLDLLKSGARNLPDEELKRAISEHAESIQNGPLKILQQKAAEFGRGKSLSGLQRETWLPQQLAGLSVPIGAIETLTDRSIKSLEESTAREAGGMVEARTSRLDKVEAFMTLAEQGWLKELGEKVTINRYEFGDKIVPASFSEGSKTNAPKKQLSSATQLGAVLQQIAFDNTTQPVEAAIVITDGGQNSGRDPRELAASVAGTALHIVPIGNTKIERDVILHHTHAPKAVLQNDMVVIESGLTAYDCDQESLQVELLAGERVIERQRVKATSALFDSRVQFKWKAAALGKQTLGMRVVPVERERTEENNAARMDILVMEEKLRVLVADNFPRWETRYLLNLFKRDERVIFDQLLFEPRRGAGEGVRSDFPKSLQEWSKYRVVVLGDVLPSQLKPEQQRQLGEYVTERGGNLIIVAGKEAMPAAYLNDPLAALLPVQAGEQALPPNNPFYLHVADEASQTLATQIADSPAASLRAWREMSEKLPIYGLSEFSKPKPATHSLIWASREKTGFDPGDASTRSFLSWHYVGAGRVIYIAAPVTYQLRYRQGDNFHHRFWGQLLRWAAARDLAEGSQTVRLSSDKLRYDFGEPVQVLAQLRQLDGKVAAGATLQIEASQHGRMLQNVALKEDPSRPGSYNVILPQLPTGPVKLQLLGDRVTELLGIEKYSRPIEITVTIDPSAELE